MGHHSQIIAAVKFNSRQKVLKMDIVWDNEKDYLDKSDNFYIYDSNLSKKGYNFLFYKNENEIPAKFKPFAKSLIFNTIIGDKEIFVVQFKERECPLIRGKSNTCFDNEEWTNFLKKHDFYKEEYCLKSNELVYFF